MTTRRAPRRQQRPYSSQTMRTFSMPVSGMMDKPFESGAADAAGENRAVAPRASEIIILFMLDLLITIPTFPLRELFQIGCRLFEQVDRSRAFLAFLPPLPVPAIYHCSLTRNQVARRTGATSKRTGATSN